jgi:succinate dehydrogenase / fumarate reductase cytochrome b subunit
VSAQVARAPGRSRPAGFYGASVGKKITMALTGAILVLFVIGHFAGNLKVYLGPEEFNHYAEGLRTLGAPIFPRGSLLWIVRIVLLVSVLTHITSAAQLWLQSKRARRLGYRKTESLVIAYASRTMVWGGLTILAFVVFHILNLTTGDIHPDFVPGDAYHNFVAGFQVVPVSVAYVLAMIPLGFHLYHGIWSAFQTLGATDVRYRDWRRPLALIIALVVVLGNMSFPVAVLAGIVR